jgi:hypothetical protein
MTPKLAVPPEAAMDEAVESTPYPQRARATTFKVTGTDNGEFTAEAAVSVNAPLYWPGGSPAGLKLTLRKAGLVVLMGATASHVPPLVCAVNGTLVDVLVT